MMHQRNIRGLSLLELSIVLVILALLVGGIVTGQALIKASQIRKQIRQFEKISVAFSTFVDQYDALPGDVCTNAPRLGLVCGNAAGGKRDDGIINSSDPRLNFTGHYEGFYVFSHLVAAKMLESQWSTYSPYSGTCTTWSAGNPLPGTRLFYAMDINPAMGMAAIEIKGKRYMFLAGGDCIWANWGPGGMTGDQAYQIDSKLDDGIPNSGNIQALMTVPWVGSIDGTVDNVPTDNCVTSAASTAYNTTTASLGCRLAVPLGR